MSQQTLNNLESGLSFRTKLNDMFTELYTKANYCVGYYDTLAALQTAHPVGAAGQWALVGNPSDPDKPYMVIWDVDTNAWEIAGVSQFVTSFNGRSGPVSPQSGDYSAFYDAIGAASAAVAAHLGAFVHGDIALNTGARHAQGTDLGLDTGGANAVTAATIVSHIGSVANPHSVTYTQVGADAAGTASGLMASHLGAYVHSDIAANTSARHTRLHALNDALDHSGNLAASQLPTGGNWALSSGLVINSGAAAVDFTLNRKTSGTAIKYDATNDIMDGDFFACTSTSGSPLRHVAIGHGVKKVAYSVVIGYNAGNAGSSGQSVCIGDSAGSASTAGTGTFVGRFAGQNAGQGAVAIGMAACQDSTGQLNTAIGNSALKGNGVNASSQIVAIGSSCLANVTGANYGVAVGTSAGSALTTSRNFILLGHNAGDFETNTYGVLHIDGYGTDAPRVDTATGRQHAIIYGYMTAAGRSTQTLALNATVTIARGLTVNDDAAALDFTVKRVTSGTAFKYNGTTDALGGDFLKLNGASGNARTIVGFAAGNATMTGAENVCIHYGAGTLLTSGTNNVLVGRDAGSKITTASDNTFVGNVAGRYQTGFYSVGVGTGALAGNSGTSTGNNNTALGYNAGGILTTGASNIFLGYSSGVYHTTESGRLVVDAYARANVGAEQANSIIYGIMASGGAASQSITFNVASSIIPSTAYHYYGDPDTDGTWRTGRSGNDLVIERRESGSYVTKSTITA